MPERLKDRWWRLNNLYFVIDEHGQKVKFKPETRVVQTELYNNLWYLNEILKSRQHGVTTFFCIFFLDCCLFKSNVRAGIIAHNREDAESFFQDKVKFAYDNLDFSLPALKNLRAATSSSARELLFSNNSAIRVGTSLRSATLQYLLVSEYGKICAKFPEKAKEIRTGALNTIHVGQFIAIESTAEGREGHFYELDKKARDIQRSGKELTKMDFKHFFFPWWKDPKNQLDPSRVVIPIELADYFIELKAKHGIELSRDQKAWYVKKYDTQQDEMKREHPSTADEAFEAAVIGAYYARQMAKVREEKRIGFVPHDTFSVVYTAWDLGVGDEMAVWFYQVSGNQVNLIDYYENVGEGLDHYAMVLAGIEPGHEYKKQYNYGGHFAPHDIKNRDILTGRSQISRARTELNLDFTRIERTLDIQNDIQLVRRFLARCFFDEEKCSRGISCLDSFRKEWNEKLGCFTNRPLHNWASHGEAGFRTVARALEKYPQGVGSSASANMSQEKADEMRRLYGPPGIG